MNPDKQAMSDESTSTGKYYNTSIGWEQSWAEALDKIANFISSEANLTVISRFIYKTLKPIFAPDCFMLSLYEASSDEANYLYVVVDEHEVSPKSRRVRIPVSGNRIEPIVREKKVSFVDNWQHEDEHAYQVISLGQNPPRVHTLLDVPIMIGNELLGILHIQSYRYSAWDKRVRELGQAIAGLLAAPILHARIGNYLNVNRSYSQCLHTVSQACIINAPSDDIITQVGAIIADQVDGICVVMLKQEQSIRLATLEHNDPVVKAIQTEFMANHMEYITSTTWGKVIESGQPLLQANINYEAMSEWKQTQVNSVAAAPILYRGETLGQIGVARFAPAPSLQPSDIHLLEAVAAMLALVITTAPDSAVSPA